MRVPFRRPLNRLYGPVVRRISRDRAGELLAGAIVEDIRRRAETSKLDPDRVMLDVLVGLVSELAEAPSYTHHPTELADLVQDAAEAARLAS